MARVSMPSRVSMTTPVWPRVQSCVRSVAGVIVAKAGISGCNFADRTNGGRLTRDDQAYSRDGLRGRSAAVSTRRPTGWLRGPLEQVRAEIALQ
jgi:hypothetical protein